MKTNALETHVRMMEPVWIPLEASIVFVYLVGLAVPVVSVSQN